MTPLRRRAVAAGWLGVLPVAGVAAARLARFDRHPILSMANAGTPFVYLPAYGALAVGVLEGRKALTTVAAAVAVAHLAWTMPELRPRRRRRPPIGGAPATTLRVVSSNVCYPSPSSSHLGRELAASGADVLLLQELSPEHRTMIKATGALDDFAYSYVDSRPGSFGAGIWSRYPLSEGETWEPGGLPMVRATIDVDGTPVRVFNVHARAPMRHRWIGVWKRQLEELRAAVGASPGPVIMAGDFNSTYGHAPFRRLLAAGLVDAHVEVGRGLATTWPCGLHVIPPLFRIDHVLVSPDLTVLDAREGVGRTSDHRPVMADLSLPKPGVAGTALPAPTAAPASRPPGS